MKKFTLIITVFCALFLTNCENPNKSRAYMDEGAKQLLRYSDFDKAEEMLTKAIRYDKQNYEAFYYRGCTRINAQKFQGAIADFEAAIALKPDYADAYFNLGKTYFLMHDEIKACEYYKLAEQYGRPNLEDYLKKCE